MEKKNLIMLAVAVVLIGGGAYWYSTKAPAPEAAPIDVAVPQLGTSSSPEASAGAPAIPAAGGAGTGEVAGKTIWRDITASDWSIVFKVQTKWKAAPTYGANHLLSQVSVAGDTESFFVSKNQKIAEPSKLSYTTKNMTIAGKKIAVHVYEKPNAANAFYWYFAFPQATDIYYFRIESAVASTKTADDFIGFIATK